MVNIKIVCENNFLESHRNVMITAEELYSNIDIDINITVKFVSK
jgi:hypothetical protein